MHFAPCSAAHFLLTGPAGIHSAVVLIVFVPKSDPLSPVRYIFALNLGLAGWALYAMSWKIVVFGWAIAFENAQIRI